MKEELREIIIREQLDEEQRFVFSAMKRMLFIEVIDKFRKYKEAGILTDEDIIEEFKQAGLL